MANIIFPWLKFCLKCFVTQRGPWCWYPKIGLDWFCSAIIDLHFGLPLLHGLPWSRVILLHVLCSLMTMIGPHSSAMIGLHCSTMIGLHKRIGQLCLIYPCLQLYKLLYIILHFALVLGDPWSTLVKIHWFYINFSTQAYIDWYTLVFNNPSTLVYNDWYRITDIHLVTLPCLHWFVMVLTDCMVTLVYHCLQYWCLQVFTGIHWPTMIVLHWLVFFTGLH